MFRLVLVSLCFAFVYPDQGDVQRHVLRRYDNGNPYVVFYIHNQTQDKLKEELYFEDGNLDYVGHFREGVEHGEWIYFWPNGEIKHYEYYENGLEEGLHFDNDESGKRLKETTWKKGSLVSTKEL